LLVFFWERTEGIEEDGGVSEEKNKRRGERMDVLGKHGKQKETREETKWEYGGNIANLVDLLRRGLAHVLRAALDGREHLHRRGLCVWLLDRAKQCRLFQFSERPNRDSM
jgi:hypothetical protein